jgi:hypothetical protein
MTGPDHFREAERLLEDDRPTVADWRDSPDDAAEHWRVTLAEAQVHATLALTAATIDAAAHDGQSVVDYLGEWWRAQS